MTCRGYITNSSRLVTIALDLHRTAPAVLRRGQRRSGGGAGGLACCPATGQFFLPGSRVTTGQKRPRAMRGQLVLPTKEPSGAVGHPCVELGFLVGCQTHEFLGCRIAHELFHLLGLFRLLELGEASDPVVTRIAAEKFTH